MSRYLARGDGAGRPLPGLVATFEGLEPRVLLSAAGEDSQTPLQVVADPVFANLDPTAGAEMSVALAPLDKTFTLHSNLGASKVIYLDFNGHVTTGTYWNEKFNRRKPIDSPAFSFEGDSSSFTDNELARIQAIWERVAEDYLPFDVDVTTEDPGTDGIIKTDSEDSIYGQRVVIGGAWADWYVQSAGGVAIMNSFGFEWGTDTPCFIFSNSLANAEKFVAEALSHETGHTLGLSHDGTTEGVEYYQGSGSGATGWAPIMGVGYYRELTQWSKGEYTNANQQQDDLAIILSNGFDYRSDDHGDILSASGLTTDGVSVWASGIIERNTDVDYFSFTTGSGTVVLNIKPFSRGPNLDIQARLYDFSGVEIATSNVSGGLNASFTISQAGSYYLSVDGTGQGGALTDYSDYASLGYYSISGTVVTVSAPDALGAESPLDAGSFRVSREGTVGDLTVYYTVSGTATGGTDYQTLSGSVVIPDGMSFATVVVTPIDDWFCEVDETVVITIGADEESTVGAPASAQLILVSDDNGDFNHDSLLDATDIDLLLAEVLAGTNQGLFDLTGDGLVNSADADTWVIDIAGTRYGDSDLDGDVDGDDYVRLVRNFTGPIPSGKGWALGSFDGDGGVDGDDYVTLVRNFTGPLSAPAAASPAPEDVDAEDAKADLAVAAPVTDAATMPRPIASAVILPDNPRRLGRAGDLSPDALGPMAASLKAPLRATAEEQARGDVVDVLALSNNTSHKARRADAWATPSADDLLRSTLVAVQLASIRPRLS